MGQDAQAREEKAILLAHLSSTALRKEREKPPRREPLFFGWLPPPSLDQFRPCPVSVDTTRLGKGTTGSSPGHLTKIAKPCRIAENRRNVFGEAICCCGRESPLPSGFS